MKKLVALILAAMTLLTLVACGPKIEGAGSFVDPY